MDTYYFPKDDPRNNRILDNFHNDFSSKINKINVKVSISEYSKQPSDKARGYIFGCIVPESLAGFRDLGNDIPNNKTGLEMVYRMLKAYGGFLEIKEISLKNEDAKKVYIYESFSNKGNIKRQNDFIDFCLRWCAENLYINIQSPEDWKKERGVK